MVAFISQRPLTPVERVNDYLVAERRLILLWVRRHIQLVVRRRIQPSLRDWGISLTRGTGVKTRPKLNRRSATKNKQRRSLVS